MARKQRVSSQTDARPQDKRGAGVLKGYQWGAAAARKYGPARAAQHNLCVCPETYAALEGLKEAEGRSFKEILRRAIAIYRGTAGLPAPAGTVIAKHGPGGDYVREVRA